MKRNIPLPQLKQTIANGCLKDNIFCAIQHDNTAKNFEGLRFGNVFTFSSFLDKTTKKHVQQFKEKIVILRKSEQMECT